MLIFQQAFLEKQLAQCIRQVPLREWTQWHLWSFWHMGNPKFWVFKRQFQQVLYCVIPLVCFKTALMILYGRLSCFYVIISGLSPRHMQHTTMEAFYELYLMWCDGSSIPEDQRAKSRCFAGVYGGDWQQCLKFRAPSQHARLGVLCLFLGGHLLNLFPKHLKWIYNIWGC